VGKCLLNLSTVSKIMLERIALVPHNTFPSYDYVYRLPELAFTNLRKNDFFLLVLFFNVCSLYYSLDFPILLRTAIAIERASITVYTQ